MFVLLPHIIYSAIVKVILIGNATYLHAKTLSGIYSKYATVACCLKCKLCDGRDVSFAEAHVPMVWLFKSLGP